MESTQVAIVGMGTVGSGVSKLLLQNGDRVARHSGRQLILAHAVVREHCRVGSDSTVAPSIVGATVDVTRASFSP